MNSSIKPPFYIGIFLISFVLLSCQFVLTRILSLVFFYHFVFLIISAVMFGLTLGALIVYGFPDRFKYELTLERLSGYTILSAGYMFLSFVSLFYLPLIMSQSLNVSMEHMIYPCIPILIIPFVLFGIVFCLLLTRFPNTIGPVYAVNLIGSAAGCVGSYFLLNHFSASTVLIILTGVAIVAGMLFKGLSSKKFIALSIAILLGLGIFGIFNQKHSLLRPLWVKGNVVSRLPIYSKWNYFSYVSVWPPDRHPFGWGFSSEVSKLKIPTEELSILIDEGAGTVLTRFNDISDLEYLKYDISNAAHQIRHANRVLVIGAGGGRDLLASVLYGAQKVDGVELNKDIIDIVKKKLPDFGKINTLPQIEIHNDDGRNFAAQSHQTYDLIQSSLVDSFAAASAGAFALSENGLYTHEAWVTYLKHLTSDGMLTFSRWYFANNFEIYRLFSLTSSAFNEIGIHDPQNHIVLLRTDNEKFINVGTVILSKTAFSDQELDQLDEYAQRMKFKVSFSRRVCEDPIYKSLLQGNYDLWDNLDVSPTTDNRPFYFYYSKLKDLFSPTPLSDGTPTIRRVAILLFIFGIIFLIVPFAINPKRQGLTAVSVRQTLFFTSIGLGFMFLEIPLIQRIGLFLGHPVYGLTVVLFSLLLASGLGSYLAPKWGINAIKRICFPVFLLIIFAFVYLLPTCLTHAMGLTMVVKILISGLFLTAIGLLMGMFFPTGMALASQNPKAPVVFYFAVNGFASMCASSLAAIFLIHLGFQGTLMFAFLFYAFAYFFMSSLTASPARQIVAK